MNDVYACLTNRTNRKLSIRYSRCTSAFVSRALLERKTGAQHESVCITFVLTILRKIKATYTRRYPSRNSQLCVSPAVSLLTICSFDCISCSVFLDNANYCTRRVHAIIRPQVHPFYTGPMMPSSNGGRRMSTGGGMQSVGGRLSGQTTQSTHYGYGQHTGSGRIMPRSGSDQHLPRVDYTSITTPARHTLLRSSLKSGP